MYVVGIRQLSSANSVNFRGCVTLSRERRPTPDKKRESIRFANSSRTFATIERTWEKEKTEQGHRVRERGSRSRAISRTECNELKNCMPKKKNYEKRRRITNPCINIYRYKIICISVTMRYIFSLRILYISVNIEKTYVLYLRNNYNGM